MGELKDERVIVTLNHQVKLETGGELRELKLRQPTAGDILEMHRETRKLRQEKASEEEVRYAEDLFLAGRLSGLVPDDVVQIQAMDFIRVQKTLTGFFQSPAPESGEQSSNSPGPPAAE